MNLYHPARVVSALVIAAIFVAGCGGAPKLANRTSAELFAMGKEKFDKKKYFQSILIFQNLVYSHAGDPVVDTAQYYLGMSYYRNGEYQLATAEFNRLLVNYPSSPFAEESQFMRAASAYESAPKNFGLDQTELDPAMKQLDDFVTDHPESPLVASAREYILRGKTRLARKYYDAAIVYVRLESYKAAGIYFQRVVDDYIDTDYGPRATFMIAEDEFKLGHFDVARDKFTVFTKVFPKHPWVVKANQRVAEAAYRFGLAAFDAGDFDRARERFQAFVSDFPDHPRNKKAQAYLARLKDLSGDKSQAGKADS
ncbi:MAG: outer membrane protein assembly factor BamD [candidate division Zixibacteria bacterium]|nr:outer membrane protein assembly factor BamD [candidate division Zixibacteria bacterium]